MIDKFVDRKEAGKVLATSLQAYAHRTDTLVLALPRGGVPVAYEVAKALGLPWDLFIVRKLGAPGHEELAMGALASGGTQVFNESMMHDMRITKQDLHAVIQAETAELKRRELLYRGNRPFPALAHQTLILVDDGMATGATMRAAIQALRKHQPTSIVVAVPVAASDTCKAMERVADKVVCSLKPVHFDAVGQWYENFPQTSDEEVTTLMGKK